MDVTTNYHLAGVDGGFVLAWSERSGGSTVIKLRAYDALLNPLGPATTAGSADAGVAFRAASDGRRAYFSWENQQNYDVSVAYLELSAPTSPTRIAGLPDPTARSSLRMGANAGGLVAVFAVDAGFTVFEAPTDGGPPTKRLVVPPEPGFWKIEYLNMSSGGTTVTVDGSKNYDADAGTYDDFDLIMALDGSRSITKYIWRGATLLDTGTGLQAAFSSYCYSTIIFFTCNESYIKADFDVWDTNSAWSTLRTYPDYTAIDVSHAAVTPADWVLSWIERRQLWIASPVPAGLAMRPRQVDIDGGLAVDTRIANSGGALNAIVYSSSLTSGALEGLLTCAP